MTVSIVPLTELRHVGHDLVRPECVLCTASGRLYVSNFRGGVSIVEADGTQWELIGDGPFRLCPNGIELEPDGSFLIAHLGEDKGGVFRLQPSGAVEPFACEVDGVALPPTNFVHRDAAGRVWITVSTRQQPRTLGFRDDVADGFVVLADERGVRIVADELGYTNECRLHPDGRRLFVNETYGKRISIFDVTQDGRLLHQRTFHEFGDGEFPDGLVFDSNGDLWVTCIVSNRVLRLGMDGSLDVIIEDANRDRISWVEAAYQEKQMGPEHLQASGEVLKNVSSLAFGGPDLRTAYLGCLLGNRIPFFRVPVAGAPLPSWNLPGPMAPSKRDS